MTTPSLVQVSLLAFAALCAGFIDAIAGGGGLITLPSLLAAGLPAHLAIGTNKGQSVFGSFAALSRYTRAGLVDGKRARLTFPLAIVGSLLGAQLVLLLAPETLQPLVLALLIAVAVFLTVYRRKETPTARPHLHAFLIAGALALGIGAYDGFFGPGTGTFLIAGFVGLLGLTLPQATADAKVVNFASNLAALATFTLHGTVLWKIALPMAGAQFLGGYLGAHVAVKGGAKVIRPVVLLVVLGLVAKISWNLYAG